MSTSLVCDNPATLPSAAALSTARVTVRRHTRWRQLPSAIVQSISVWPPAVVMWHRDARE